MSQALLELLHGKGAHVDPVACIEDVPPDLAIRKPDGFAHSIADLLFHMNYWMRYELCRIHGEKAKYPEHNAESFPQLELTESEWDTLKLDFVSNINEFARLAESSPDELDRQVESVHDGDKKVAANLESVLWQIAVHNSYHTGQIAQLRRAMKTWPPPSGSDTW